MLTIDLETARRFILGKQGLWPGRRWRGIQGAEQAMREMEYLQLDPLQIVARSHDITLHSRVLDYTPGLWEAVAYQQRKFFDWGGWLAVRPMDELPYWRLVMRREREGGSDYDLRIRRMGREHAEAIDEMLTICGALGTVSNRELRDGCASTNAKLSWPQGQRPGLVLFVAYRRSHDAPPREFRARVCTHGSGCAERIGLAKMTKPR